MIKKKRKMLQIFVLLTVHHGSILVKKKHYVGDRLDGHLHRVTYTRSHINTTDSPDDEHRGAQNM
jgi:hypothetical protein